MSSSFVTSSGARAEPVLLAGRPASDWQRIVAAGETRRFVAGDTVIRAGDRDRTLLLLTAGELEGAGRRFRAPAVLGEVAFLDGGPRSMTVVACAEAEVLRLSLEAFEVLAAHHPELGRALLLDLGAVLAWRLRRATERLSEQGR